MFGTERRRLRNWLTRFGSRFEIGFIVTDPRSDDAIVFVNKTFTKITGYSLEEVKGRNLRFLHGDGTDMDLIREIDQKLQNGHPVSEELQQYKKDGTPIWIELMIQPLLNENGNVLYHAAFLLDVSNRKKDESILKLHEHLFIAMNKGKRLTELIKIIYKATIDFIPEGSAPAYLSKEKEGNWTILTSSSIPPSLINEIESKKDFGTFYSQTEGLFVDQLPPSTEHDYVESWSLPIFNLDGKVNELLTIFVTKQTDSTGSYIDYLKKLLPIIQMAKTFFEQQRRLEWLAYIDPPTQLPNRHSIIEALNRKNDERVNYVVATVQPAEYVSIIDLYGREAADEFFIQLANRIELLENGEATTIGRVSSDSLVFVNNYNDITEIDLYANQLRKVTAEPFIVAGTDIFITLKVGFALSQEGCSAEEMLRRSDAALTNANRQNGYATSFYKDLKNKEAVKEMTIVNELFKAITTNTIDVHLQPKVNLKDGKIISFEALARWYSPELGHVPPNDFIPVAERIGKIIELEMVIIKKVLMWLRKRQSEGKKMYQVAVNISVDHFFHSSLVPSLKQLVAKYEISPQYLRLELTESIGLVDFKNAKSIFNELHEANFDVSIDDFGVGYSSLSYLPKLQVSELKIDRSFIHAINEQDTHAVVTTIIQLANNLRLSIVAEGIEEAHQVEALIALGCQTGQGYYFFKPLPLHEVDNLLE